MTKSVTVNSDDMQQFSSGYHQAKNRLIQLVSELKNVAYQKSILLAAGIYGELSTDLVWIGSKQAENVLVLISATHGVEGHVGAAIQNDLIMRIKKGYFIDSNTAVLIIFALNPYGFAHDRRCDEAGIDLNRNCVDFTQPLPVNSGYEQLREAMAWDREERKEFFTRMQKQLGQTAFEIAISGGQYSDPQGPFFGGLQQSHGLKVIDTVLEELELSRRHLAVIDIHSGLGFYGYGEIICDHLPESSGLNVARKWYGVGVTSPESGDSTSVPKYGLLDYCWHPFMQQRGCFVTLEFGTYKIADLFNVIIEDHQLWRRANRIDIQQSAQAMRSHFYPEDVYWRELILVKARQVIQQALKGLGNE
jgi:predicted deacylase